MIFGPEHVFSREHFEAHKGFAPAPLCELVVYCLELVSQLCASGLEYRFKGGNSQLVLLDTPERFSIDVDIVTTVDKSALIELVEGITAACERFTRCEVRQHKTKPWLPMVSFKLFFDSVYQSTSKGAAGADEDPHVMLDAVLEPAPYPGVKKQVVCGALYRSDQMVELPDVSGLIADKLLCIGPSTLGIPLGKNKEAQRLKHVFDVATLSRQGYDPGIFEPGLEACMAQENRIQRSEWSRAEVLEDTRVFVAAPLAHADKPEVASLEPGTYLDEIVRGFDDFGRHLFRVDYTWQRFQDDCRQILGLIDELAAH